MPVSPNHHDSTVLNLNRSQNLLGATRARTTGDLAVGSATPYQTALDAPNVPVILPQAPEELDGRDPFEALPRFPLSARLGTRQTSDLPANTLGIIGSNFDVLGGQNSDDVMISFQTIPQHWNGRTLYFTPQTWLHPDAAENGLTYGTDTQSSAVAVSAAQVGHAFTPPAFINYVNTGNEGGSGITRFSTQPSLGLLTSGHSPSETLSFYTLCLERSTVTGRYTRTGLTFHCLLSQDDEVVMNRALAALNSLPQEQRTLTGLINILRTSPVISASHTIPLDELGYLVTGSRPSISSPQSSTLLFPQQRPRGPASSPQSALISQSALSNMVSNSESSMQAVSSQSSSILSRIRREQATRFQQLGGANGVINHFRDYCEQNFGSLATISSPQSARAFTLEQRQAYISNHWHTAYRYFGYPRVNTTIPSVNYFMNPDAAFQTQNSNFESTTSALSSRQIEDIAYYWLAVSDPSIDETLRLQLQESFTTGLAQLTRGHNWDGQRWVTRSNGRQEQEYYDNLGLDEPTCGMGVSNRLTMTLVNHPMLEDRSNINIMQDMLLRFREFRVETFREYLRSLSSTERQQVIDTLPTIILCHGTIGGLGIEEDDEWDDILLYTQSQDQTVNTTVQNFITGYPEFFRQRLSDFHSESRRRYGSRYRQERPTHLESSTFVEMGTARGSAANVVYESYESFFNYLSMVFLGAHPNNNGIDFNPTILDILNNSSIQTIAASVNSSSPAPSSPQSSVSGTGTSSPAPSSPQPSAPQSGTSSQVLYFDGLPQPSPQPSVPELGTSSTQAPVVPQPPVVPQQAAPVISADGYFIAQQSHFGGLRRSIRSQGVVTAGPYQSQMPMPSVPVFHPYNPTAGVQGIPYFPLSVTMNGDDAEHLPNGTLQLLAAHGLNENHLTVNVSFQEHAWNGAPLIFRPHTQLHQAGEFQAGVHQDSNIMVAVAGSREGFASISGVQNVNTHSQGGRVVYSPNNLALIGDQGRGATQNLYSLVIDAANNRAYLTFHALLSPQDSQTLEQIVDNQMDPNNPPTDQDMLNYLAIADATTGIDVGALSYLLTQGAQQPGQVATNYRVAGQQDPTAQLIQGFQSGNDNLVLSMLQARLNSSNIDRPLGPGQGGLLHHAMYFGCYQTAEYLLQQGANPNLQVGARTPLENIQQSPSLTSQMRVQLTQLLSQYQQSIAPPSPSSSPVTTQVSQPQPLSHERLESFFRSRQDRNARQYLERCTISDLNAPLGPGQGGLLHSAIYYGCYQAAEYLLQQGADASIRVGAREPIANIEASPFIQGDDVTRYVRLISAHLQAPPSTPQVQPVSSSQVAPPSAPQVQPISSSQVAPPSAPQVQPTSSSPSVASSGHSSQSINLYHLEQLLTNRRDVEARQYLSSHHIDDPDAPLGPGQGGLLHSAIYYGCYQATEYLLQQGANPGLRVGARTPLENVVSSPRITQSDRQRYNSLVNGYIEQQRSNSQQAPAILSSARTFTPSRNNSSVINLPALSNSEVRSLFENSSPGRDERVLSYLRSHRIDNIDGALSPGHGALLHFAMYFGCPNSAEYLISQGANISSQVGARTPRGNLEAAPSISPEIRQRLSDLLTSPRQSSGLRR